MTVINKNHFTMKVTLLYCYILWELGIGFKISITCTRVNVVKWFWMKHEDYHEGTKVVYT